MNGCSFRGIDITKRKGQVKKKEGTSDQSPVIRKKKTGDRRNVKRQGTNAKSMSKVKSMTKDGTE
jgi:hypothetical protein